jgi:L-amino acid N-acyltransferase YncA
MIREVQTRDVNALCAIYNHYVKNTIVTFANTPASEETMAETIVTAGPSLPWLVWEEPGADRVTGYAACSAWKSRCSYEHSLETTIYLEHGTAGQGTGTLLYGELLARVEEAGYHTALSGIALPNPASVALHEKLGFEKVGHLKEVGFKFGQWVDVGYWQKVF